VVVLITRILAFSFFSQFSELPIAQEAQFPFLASFAQSLPWLSHLSASIMILISGVLFNQIAYKIKLMTQQNTFVALCFGLLISLWPSNLWLNPFLMSLPILIWATNILMSQPQNTLQLQSVFNSALWAGVAALLFPPNGTFLVIATLILINIFPTKWRHFVLLFIGFFTPQLFYSSILYLTDQTSILAPLINTLGIYPVTSSYPVHYALAGLIALSVPLFLKNYGQNIVRTRKMFTIQLLWLFINSALFLVFYNYNQGWLGFIILPFTVILSGAFLMVKKWWLSDLFFLAFLAVIGWSHYIFYNLLITT
jgi:hypothetical protein